MSSEEEVKGVIDGADPGAAPGGASTPVGLTSYRSAALEVAAWADQIAKFNAATSMVAASAYHNVAVSLRDAIQLVDDYHDEHQIAENGAKNGD